MVCRPDMAFTVGPGYNFCTILLFSKGGYGILKEKKVRLIFVSKNNGHDFVTNPFRFTPSLHPTTKKNKDKKSVLNVIKHSNGSHVPMPIVRQNHLVSGDKLAFSRSNPPPPQPQPTHLLVVSQSPPVLFSRELRFTEFSLASTSTSLHSDQGVH